MSLIALGLQAQPPGSLDAFTALAVSPDGRWAAVATDWRLAVFDLDRAGAVRDIAEHPVDGIAWGTHSRRLAFVEHPAQRPSVLWLSSPDGSIPARPLFEGPAYKGEPAWLSDGTLAFLSDAQSEDRNIWLIGVFEDERGGRPFKLIDHHHDIVRLWAMPYRADPAAAAQAGALQAGLVYQTVTSAGGELWWWHPGADASVRIDEHGTVPWPAREAAAFAPRRPRLLFQQRREFTADRGWELVLFDLAEQRALHRLELESLATGLEILGDGRIVATVGRKLVLWDTDAGWLRRDVQRLNPAHAPLGLVSRLGATGLAVQVAGEVLLAGHDAEDLESGELLALDVDGLLGLAQRHLEEGRIAESRQILDVAWQRPEPADDAVRRTAVVRYRLERLARRWRHADDWLEAAAEAVGTDDDTRPIHLERLALALFDRRDEDRAADLVDELASEPAEPWEPELVEWCRTLLDGTPGRRPARAWQRIGGEIRQGDYDSASDRLRELFKDHEAPEFNARGLKLILAGGLEPLSQFEGEGAPHLQSLVAQLAFQEVLLAAIRESDPTGPEAGEMRSLLLEQWVVRGDTDLARRLVDDDLERARPGTLPYQDLLRQFLLAEERPRWVDRAVTDVLLREPVPVALLDLMSDPEDRLTVQLARTKAALIERDERRAQDYLNEAWTVASQLTPEARSILQALDSGASGSANDTQNDPFAASGDESAFRRIRDLFLMELFQAKISEARGHYSDAMRAYRACLALTERVPADWQTLPFDLQRDIGLIEAGSRSPDLLGTYLRMMNAIGDPMLDLSPEVAQVTNTLENFELLARRAGEDWIRPHLEYGMGMCCSLLEWRALALAHLGRARELNPDPPLLQRILLEEAALRDSLGQYALAARLYARIVDLPVAPSVRAGALVAAIQSELAAGMSIDPATRAGELIAGRLESPAWRRWVYLQLGDAP